MKKKTLTLSSQKEYTFLKYENILFKNQKSQQSLFNGSVFRDCTMQNCDYAKCDFEGAVFYNVVFNKVNLSFCDIKSSYFNNCQFWDCSFSSSAVTDNDFINCKFINCLYNDAILRNMTYKNCIITNGNFDMATITLSKFIDCEFNNLLLGNCSFYDHIFDKCHYNNVIINIDTIGRVFGLTLKDLKNFQYIFLGKVYGYAPEEFFNRLDKIFKSKEWRLQQAIYKYNVESFTSYEFIIEIFDTLSFFISNNIIVKHDDLLFLANIIDCLKTSHSLPMFALYQGLEKLGIYMKYLGKKDYINKEELFREFINKMFFTFNELLADFAELFPENLEIGVLQRKVLIRIHYDGEKEIDFSQYINDYLKYMGYNDSYYCHLSETKPGSIIEIIVGSIIGVYALQILLYGLNGVIVQLTDMLSKISVIKNKNYQRDFLSNSIKGHQRQPEVLQNTFDLLKDKNFNRNITSLISALKKTKILDVSVFTDDEERL